MALSRRQRSLRSWSKQKWRTKSGKKSSVTGERYLPSAAIKALSPAEYAATTREKRRDKRERGRTIKSIKDQYNSTVLPMHNKYVEPSKVFSDLILDGRDNINDITNKIEELIKS